MISTKRLQRPLGPALRVRAIGTGTATCLLIHGYGEGGYIWEPITAAFASRYALEIPDLRGHGESEWDPTGGYEMIEYAADIAHLVRTLPRRPLVLIGHSLGGHIAAHVTEQLPELVDALILVDSGPVAAANATDEMMRNLRESLQPFASLADFVRWQSQRRPLVGRDCLEHFAANALKRTDDGFRLRIDPALARPKPKASDEAAAMWNTLSKINCPTLVVRGEGSAVLTSSVATKMTQVMRQARLATIGLAGHAVMADNPQRFTEVALQFLGDILSAR